MLVIIKALIQLQYIQWNTVQQAQRGTTSSEIIHGDFKAQLVYFINKINNHGLISASRALKDFKLNQILRNIEKALLDIKGITL